MDKLHKTLIVALSMVVPMLVISILSLIWQDWANQARPGLVYLPGYWIGRADGGSTWSGNVMGAAVFGLYISWIFISARAPRKRLSGMLAVGLIWGVLSWFLGALSVMAGLLGVLATVYVLRLHTWISELEEDPNSGNRELMEAVAMLVICSCLSIGLRYNLTNGLQAIIFVTALFVCMFVAHLLFCLYKRGKEQEASGQSTGSPE